MNIKFNTFVYIFPMRFSKKIRKFSIVGISLLFAGIGSFAIVSPTYADGSGVTVVVTEQIPGASCVPE